MASIDTHNPDTVPEIYMKLNLDLISVQGLDLHVEDEKRAQGRADNPAYLTFENLDYGTSATANPAAENPRTHDLSQPFRLVEGDVPDFNSLYQSNPQLAARVQELFGLKGEAGFSPSEVRPYREAAMMQLIARYGEERVEKLIDTLQQLSSTQTLATYNQSFRRQMGSDDKTRINTVMYNFADFLEPGGLELLRDVGGKLREEGHKRSLSLREFNPQLAKLLSQNPEERRAFIAFENNFSLTEHSRLREVYPQNTLSVMTPMAKLKSMKEVLGK